MKRIIVEHLSKIYQLGASEERDLSFRELLLSQITSVWSPSQKKKPFYALNDVSFEVEEGEVFGVIGKNGSGKSTLLKILSRITSPTSGKATLKGRVASLLEVGTGFHAELSGRENIYLSGVILGMKRWEITAHFDEIVAFAGVEQFLDIPVKKYSSGMRLRLAFAVAAFLSPEILLIDEVLAVGDYEFEKKCIQSMGEMGKAGRTIVFVSHNLVAIKKLCSRVLVLKNGYQQYLGDPIQATATHLGTQKIAASSLDWGSSGLQLGLFLYLKSIKTLSVVAEQQDQFFLSEPVTIQITFKRIDAQSNILFLLSFYDEADTLLFSSSRVINHEIDVTVESEEIISCLISGNIFEEGLISIGLEIFDLGLEGALSNLENTILFSQKNILSFFMKESDFSKKNNRTVIFEKNKGKVKPLLQWNNSYVRSQL